MTGTGIHILDAFVNAAGPVAEVQAQFISVKRDPDPRDTISVLFRFENGVSGLLGAELLIGAAYAVLGYSVLRWFERQARLHATLERS
jgi:predicted dehydrogenase